MAEAAQKGDKLNVVRSSSTSSGGAEACGSVDRARATLLKVLNNLADIKSGGVALRVRTQATGASEDLIRRRPTFSRPERRHCDWSGRCIRLGR
jgi:hypothetical protein